MRHAIQELPIGDDNFIVRRFTPESFLVLFASQHARDGAMRGGSVPVGAMHLFFWPWTQIVRAASDTMHHKMSLEIEGIPTHAWGWRAVRKILTSFCWIESLDPSSEDCSDITCLSLIAWTDNPNRIPKQKTLIIAEHELHVVYNDPYMQRIFANVHPYLRQKKVPQAQGLGPPTAHRRLRPSLKIAVARPLAAV